MGYVAPAAGACAPVASAFTSTGVILVLFILLVIVSRSWMGL